MCTNSHQFTSLNASDYDECENAPVSNDVVKRSSGCRCVFLKFLQRKRSAVSKVKQGAQEVLEQGEHLLAEANQLSDNINKEVEVHKH